MFTVMANGPRETVKLRRFSRLIDAYSYLMYLTRREIAIAAQGNLFPLYTYTIA